MEMDVGRSHLIVVTQNQTACIMIVVMVVVVNTIAIRVVLLR
jgi:hypothetical protein